MIVQKARTQRRIQDFKLGGGALKKIAPSGGRRKHFWGISCEKSRFYATNSYFFPILGGAHRVRPLPPGSAPDIYLRAKTNGIKQPNRCLKLMNIQTMKTDYTIYFLIKKVAYIFSSNSKSKHILYHLFQNEMCNLLSN